MPKKTRVRAVIFFLLTAVFFKTAVFGICFSAEETLPQPGVSAKAAALMIAGSAEFLYSKNAEERLPMASTTKIMTALVALERYDVSKCVKISKEAVGIEGSSIYLYEGEELTMEELLFALLLESANDAATAIAVEVAGSVAAFSDLMNEKAGQLGLVNTHFTNPHGLYDEQHYTTAEELAKIAAAALQNETFREIVSTYKKVIPLRGDEGSRLLLNHNRLLKSYEGAIGVKTGYTKKSGRCLVSAAERDGVMLVSVTLSAPDDWRDHEAMLNYGFSCCEDKLLADSGELGYTVPVIGGNIAFVKCSNNDQVSANLPKEGQNITKTVELSRFYFAPLKKGETLGRVVFRNNGQVVGQAELTAEYDVEAVSYKKTLWEKIVSFFTGD